MPQIIVKKDFRFAHRGCEIVEYFAGDEPVEVSDRCAEVALAEGWAVDAGGEGAPKAAKSKKAVPEDKSE